MANLHTGLRPERIRPGTVSAACTTDPQEREKVMSTTHRHHDFAPPAVMALVAAAVLASVPPARAVPAVQAQHSIRSVPSGHVALPASFLHLPLSFEQNVGQAPPDTKFLAHSKGYSISLSDREATLVLSGASAQLKRNHGHLTTVRASGPNSQPSILHIRTSGGSGVASAVPEEKQPGHVNYYVGADPTKWHSNVPVYGKVRYSNVYPGVDLVYYGSQRQLEHDFVVQPGANPAQIALSLTESTVGGEDRPAGTRLDSHGDLSIEVPSGTVTLQKPEAYQVVSGIHHSVPAAFRMAKDGSVHFTLAQYDSRKSLVIDPVLTYSTTVGGTGNEYSNGIALDQNGNIYITGYSDSPTGWGGTEAGSVQLNPAAIPAYVTEINAAGTLFDYTTFLSGNSGTTVSNAITVDASGNAYIGGQTNSTNFPHVLGQTWSLTSSAISGTIVLTVTVNGGAASSTEALPVASTAGVIQNALAGLTNVGAGNVTVTGGPLGTAPVLINFVGALASQVVNLSLNATQASNGTVTLTAPAVGGTALTVDGTSDAFVAKIGPTGNVVTTELLGGAGDDAITGIAIDPVSLVVQSTYVPVYVTGTTTPAAGSESDFLQSQGVLIPTTQQGLQHSPQQKKDGEHAFVVKLDPTLQTANILYWTYIYANPQNNVGTVDVSNAIVVDNSGQASITGYTNTSAGFTSYNSALVSEMQTGIPGGNSGFLTTLTASGGLLFETILGAVTSGNAIAIEEPALAGESTPATANVYVTGEATQSEPPTYTLPVGGNPYLTSASLYPTKGSNGSAFVIEMNPANGSLQFGTYLGGTGLDYGTAIAVDQQGYVTVYGSTNSQNLPVTPSVTVSLASPPSQASILGAFQSAYGGGTEDTFIAKLNPSGSALRYISYLGGELDDKPTGMTMDTYGNAWVTGSTNSNPFPAIGVGPVSPLQPNPGGGYDAFICRVEDVPETVVGLQVAANLNPLQNTLTWSDSGSNQDRGHGTGYLIWRAAYNPTGVGTAVGTWQVLAAVDGNATSYTDNYQLAESPNTTFVYAISALATLPDGTQVISAPNYSMAPQAPTNLTATATYGNFTQLNISFTDTTADANYYVVSRQDGGAGSFHTICVTYNSNNRNYVPAGGVLSLPYTPGASSGTVSFVDGNLNPATEYTYKVQAFYTNGVYPPQASCTPGLTTNVYGKSAFSAVASGTTDIPSEYYEEKNTAFGANMTNLSATPATNTSTNSMVLTWDLPAAGDPYREEIAIFRYEEPAVGVTELSTNNYTVPANYIPFEFVGFTAGPNDTAYTDTNNGQGLSPNTGYTWWVQPFNHNDPQPGGTPEGYYIQVGAGQAQYQSGNIQPGEGDRPDNNGPPTGNWVTAVTDHSPPNAPTNLAVTAVNSGVFRVQFTNTNPNIATQYTLFYQEISPNTASTFTQGTQGVFNDNGAIETLQEGSGNLIAGATYAVKIWACTQLCSAYSNTATVTLPYNNPGAASQVTVTGSILPATSTAPPTPQVTVTWVDTNTLPDGVTPDFDSFIVNRRTPAGSASQWIQVFSGPVVALPPPAAAGTFQWQDTGVNGPQANTSYDYEVIAARSTDSTESVPTIASPSVTLPDYTPNSPLNFTAVEAGPIIGQTQINLSWTPAPTVPPPSKTPAGATIGYQLFRQLPVENLTGSATGGTFTLSAQVGAGPIQTTLSLPFDATAAAVQAALGALPAIGAANVSATGGPVGTAPVVIGFIGPLASSVVSLTDNAAAVTGGTITLAQGGTQYLFLATIAGATTYQDMGLTPGVQYNYELFAYGAMGSLTTITLSLPTEASATTLPLAPTTQPSNLAVTPSIITPGKTMLTVSWTDTANPPDYTGFSVQRRLAGTVPWTSLGNLSLPQAGVPFTTGQTTFSVQDLGVDLPAGNLTANTTYQYQITPTLTAQGVVEDGPSAITSGSTYPSPPIGVITNLGVINATGTSLGLTWQYNGGDESGFVITRTAPGGLPVTIAGEPIAPTVPLTNPPTFTFTDAGADLVPAGLASLTTYTYVVAPYISVVGNLGASANTTGTTLAPPPAAPTQLTVTVPPAPAGATSLVLSWADTKTDFTSFIVKRSVDNGVTFPVTLPYTIPNPLPANGVYGITDTGADLTPVGLLPNTTYVYEVFAVNSAVPPVESTMPAISAPATTLRAVPAAPTITAALPVANPPGGLADLNTIIVNWTDTVNPTGVVTYNLTRTNVATGAATTLVNVGTQTSPGNFTYTDGGTLAPLPSGTEYTYSVFALDNGGTSPAAVSADVATLPNAPTTATATVPGPAPISPNGSQDVDISWMDTTADYTSFLISRTSGSTTISLLYTPTASAPSFTYHDGTVLPNTTYTYSVYALNALGAPIGQSLTGATANTVTTLMGAPTAPTNVQAVVPATGTGASSLIVTWIDGTNAVGTVTYNVIRTPVAGGAPATFTGVGTEIQPATTPPSFTFTDTGLASGTEYTYQVQAVNNGGTAASVSSAGTYTLPSPPASATAVVPAAPAGSTEIDVSWVDNAAPVDYTGFNLVRTGGAGQVNILVPLTSPLLLGAAPNFSYHDTSVASNTAYSYTVYATNPNGINGQSVTGAATPTPATTLMAAPAAPQNVAVQVPANATGATSLIVTWSDIGTDFTSFNVVRTPVAGGAISTFPVPGTQFTFTDTGLSTGSHYSYVVQAVNNGGVTGSPAGPNAWTLPAPPTAITASVPLAPTGSTEVDLTWTDANADYSGFDVVRTGGTGGPATFTNVGVAVIPATVPPSFIYSDKSAASNTTYTYSVYALNPSGGESFTPAVIATPVTTLMALPAAPTNVVATVTGGGTGATSLTVTWTDANSDFTGFNVIRTPVAGGPSVTATGVGTLTTPGNYTYTDSALSPGTEYTYVVQAVNNGGPTSSAPSQGAWTLPSPPASVNATVPAAPAGSTEIDLTWVDNAAPADYVGFGIARTGGAGPVTIAFPPVGTPLGTGPNFAYQDKSVSPNTLYNYTIYAVNPAGGSSVTGPTTSGTTLRTPPQAPTNVTATVATPTSLVVTWSDTATDWKSFNVIRTAVAGGTAPVTFTAVGSPTTPGIFTYTDTGLLPGTQYVYIVEAVNNGGPTDSTPSQGTYTLPNPPASIASSVPASAAGATEIDLSWVDNATPADYAEFTLVRTGGAGQVTITISLTSPLLLGTAPNFAYQDKSVSPDTSYTYTLYAVNVAGGRSLTGPSTSSMTLKTTATAPTNVAATVPVNGTGATSLIVTWSDPANDWSSFNVVRTPVAGGPSVSLTNVGSPTTTGNFTYTDTGLASGTQYSYTVQAVNNSGPTSSTPTTGTWTLPSPVASVTSTVPAAPAGATEINLSWVDSAAPADYVGFSIARTGGAGPVTIAFPPVGTPLGSGPNFSYQDKSVSPNTVYQYTIYAVNPAGGSAVTGPTTSSTTLKAAPAAPTNVVATVPVGAAGETSLIVTWSDTGTDWSSFNVVRTPLAGGPSVTFTNVGLPTTPGSFTYTDTGLSTGTQYAYTVVAINSGGPTSSTPTVGTWTLPSAPASLTSTVPAAPAGATEIDLAWVDNTAPADYSGFSIVRTGGTGPVTIAFPPTGTALGSGPSFTYQDKSASADTTYIYTVYAVNPAGGQSATGPTTTNTTLRTSPAAPTNVTVTVPGNGTGATSLFVSWVDGSNAVGTVSYNVIRTPAAGGTPVTFTSVGTAVVPATNPPSFTFTDTGLSSGTLYIYEVQSVNNGGTASSAPTTPGTYTLPSPPASASAVVPAAPAGSTQINLSWVDNAAPVDYTGFNIIRTGGAGPVNITIALGSPLLLGTGPNFSYHDTSVASDTAYSYTVYATNPNGINGQSVTGASIPAPVTTLNALPAGPVNVSASVPVDGTGGTSLIVTWSDSSADFNSFNLIRTPVAGGASVTLTSVGTLVSLGNYSYTDTGLSTGTEYTYVVQAVNNGGATSSASSTGVWTLPSAPTSAAAAIPAAPAGSGEVDLTWVDKTSPADYVGFSIVRTGGTGTVTIAFPPVGTPLGSGPSFTYADTSVAPNTTYTYTIYAVNPAGGLSVAGAGVTAPTTLKALPIAPTNVVATVPTDGTGASSLIVTWTDTSTTDHDSFNLIRTPVSGGAAVTLTNVGTALTARTFTYTDTGLASGTAYTYVVQAVNNGGSTSSVASQAVTTLPAPPGTVTAVIPTAPAGTTQVDLTWVDNANPVDYTGFTIVRTGGAGTVNITYPLVGTPLPAGPTFTYADTTASANTQYTYTVYAVNAVGGKSVTGSVATAVTTLMSLPTAPTFVSVALATTPPPADAAGRTSLVITWADAATDWSSFNVVRTPVGGLPVTLTNVGTAVTPSTTPATFTYTDTGLTAGTAYTYVVQSVNNGGATSSAATKPLSTLPNPPNSPASVTVTSQSATSMMVTWPSSVSDSTHGAATTYQILRGVGLAPTSFQALSSQLAVSGFTQSYTDTNLTPGTTYTYEIIASDAGGAAAAPYPTGSASTPPTPPLALVVNRASAPCSPETALWRSVRPRST